MVYAVAMYLMVLRSYDSTPKALCWAERMQKEAGAYLEAQPVVRVFGGAAASTFRARLGEYVRFLSDWQRPFIGAKTVMDLATRPTTFLLLICVFGTLWVTDGTMSPLDLLPFLLLGTTFGSRLLGIGYGLSGLRDGLLAATRVQRVIEDDELAASAPSEAAASASAASARAEGVRFDGVGFGYRTGAPVFDRDAIVEQLPDGWESRAGEAGSALSGGERQRVSIARALLKPAPVLLVDEATSALDAENEAAIAAALTGDPVPRTRVIVAHRLSSIRSADRIVFLERGRVVEEGGYDELLARDGRFARFHRQQRAAAAWRIGEVAPEEAD
ncbi:ATP-binding cassette domain-containing protein [Microbacterium sp. ARD32]|uniref:ATP-binding cassette domain-containing protein n=1 Tax=Microbacterium sp. ARD32 TaxID=2962577 RepID=UPI002880C221|nr:ATP-binding cassette domain-containing protein [Microbacterium sp. ARD32]MDT0156462.1 ATP-binding cassette domain-containing protein [Microbacterium sp. ARD32]